MRPGGEIGRRGGLKPLWRATSVRVQVPSRAQSEFVAGPRWAVAPTPYFSIGPARVQRLRPHIPDMMAISLLVRILRTSWVEYVYVRK